MTQHTGFCGFQEMTGENTLEVSAVVPFAGICMLLGMAFYYRVKSSELISCLPQSCNS